MLVLLYDPCFANPFAQYDIKKMEDLFQLTSKLLTILFVSQRFASCNIYNSKAHASTECLNKSNLQTFAFAEKLF